VPAGVTDDATTRSPRVGARGEVARTCSSRPQRPKTRPPPAPLVGLGPPCGRPAATAVADLAFATPIDRYAAPGLTVRDHLLEHWLDTMDAHAARPVKFVGYRSARSRRFGLGRGAGAAGTAGRPPLRRGDAVAGWPQWASPRARPPGRIRRGASGPVSTSPGAGPR
jgi:hypothetical protein